MKKSTLYATHLRRIAIPGSVGFCGKDGSITDDYEKADCPECRRLADGWKLKGPIPSSAITFT